MILRLKDCFRPKEQGGTPRAGIPGDRESGTPGGAKNRSRFSGRFGAVAIFLCLAAYVFLPSDTPAQDDPMTNAGFGYLRGLKGEYFDNSDPRLATTVEPVRGANAPNPWSYNTSACTNANDDDCDGAGSGGADSTSCCCPQHLNVNAARLEDGKEALLSTLHTGNAIRLKDFPMSRYGDPEITDALVWVRYMCRRQSPTICAAVTTAFTADGADPVRFRIRFRGNVQSMTTADITDCPSDFRWISFSLCGNTSPATPWKCDPSAGGTSLTWKELGEIDNLSDGEQDNIGITIELYVVGDEGTRGLNDWRWILWDVGYIEVISAPMLRGSRVDPVVDFGNPAGAAPNYAVDWRLDDSPTTEGSGGPSSILLNRSSTVNVANSGTAVQSVCAGTVANSKDLNNLTTAYTCGDVAGYWGLWWGSPNYVNKVKIYWNTQIGSNLGNPLLLQWSPDTTTGLNGTWYTLKTIYRQAMAAEARGEQTYAFPTVAARGFRISNNGVADGFSFWEFHAYPEQYDYFEARWIGEVNVDAAWTGLCTVSDDGARLWVDEVSTKAWLGPGPAPDGCWYGHTALICWDTFANLKLTAGWHQVRMEYYEGAGGAAARLGYCSDETCTTCTAIPTERLRASWEGPTNFSFLSGWFANYWAESTPTTINPEAPNDGIWKGFEHNQEINFEWMGGLPCPLKQEVLTTYPTVTILSEGFESTVEGGIPAGSWSRTPDTACVACMSWGADLGANARRIRTGNGVMWCDGKCYNSAASSYRNNANTYLIYGPFNLFDASSASFQFYAWVDQSGDGDDNFYYYASPDGITWYGPADISNAQAWNLYTMNLGAVPTIGSLLGDSSVWIAFRFTSDGGTVDTGSWVDDVLITKVVPITYDKWNARYTGFIRAEYAGTLSVCLTADGGARLDLDGDTTYEINTWAGKTAVERICYNRTVTTPGEIYTVLEYYDNNTAPDDNATLKLEWTPVAPEYVSTSDLQLQVVNDFLLDSDGNTRALYHLNEGAGVTAIDSAGAANNGTITGATWEQVPLGTDEAGNPVNAPKLYFDGVGDVITVANVGATELDIADQITIEAWIKFPGCDTTKDYYPAIAHIEGPRNYGFYLHCTVGTGAIQLHYSYLPAGGVSLCGTLSNNVAVGDNQWHHVAVAADPGDYEWYYSDGIMVKYFDIDTDLPYKMCGVTETVQTGDTPLNIGDSQFVGMIDEVRITAADLSNNGNISPTPGIGFPPSNSYSYHDFDPTKTYNIVSATSECLEYDIFLAQTNPQFLIGFDGVLSGGTCSIAGAVRDTSRWWDQNKLVIHPNTDLSAQAKGKWYHRCFKIGGEAGDNNQGMGDGCTLSNPKIAFEGDLPGTYSAQLDNVIVTNETWNQCITQCVTGPHGATLINFYDIGGPGNAQAEGPTASLLYDVLTNYPQGVNILSSQFLYANGLRRFVYESEYEALAWPPAAGAQQSYFSRQICQGIDVNIRDHNFGANPPEIMADAELTGSAASVIPDCSGKTRADHWAIRWEGALYAPQNNRTYCFQMLVNEVGKLTIDNSVVISSCGNLIAAPGNTDTTCTAFCTPTTLTQGWHYLDVDLIEGTGNARMQLRWDYPTGSYEDIPTRYLAIRQYISGAIEGAGGVGPGREAGSNPMLIFSDIMDMFNKAIANTGFTCSTVFDGSAETDAQLLNALRGLRDYFLAKSRIGEIYTRLYYRISNPISRVLEAYPFLKQAARTVLNPFVQLGKLLKGQGHGSKANADMAGGKAVQIM